MPHAVRRGYVVLIFTVDTPEANPICFHLRMACGATLERPGRRLIPYTRYAEIITINSTGYQVSDLHSGNFWELRMERNG